MKKLIISMLCAAVLFFAFLIFVAFTRPATKSLFHLRTYDNEEEFKTDLTKMIWEGYEVQHMSEGLDPESVRYRHHWTVIYVKRR